ncbi:MAG: hypothetical protein JWN67_3587 [Actinomycetia bacterium]|nr:hypothetical protein [Actinomycetes bacterium]
MELMATDSGPRYMAPKLTARQTWKEPIDGLAMSLVAGRPAVPKHDAAATVPLSTRIDMLL